MQVARTRARVTALRGGYAIQMQRLFLIVVLAVLTTTLPTLDKGRRPLLDSLDALLVTMVLLKRQPLLEHRLALLCGAREERLAVCRKGAITKRETELTDGQALHE